VIDLIICTYNNAGLLDRTLASIAEQQVPAPIEWAVCVVDNNSTDATPAVIEKYIAGGRIPGLHRIAEVRQGLTPARLCGIRHTHGPWIAFVDDDCVLCPDWVAQAARFAHVHPRCGVFGGRVILDWEVPPPPLLRRHAMSFAASDHGPQPRQLPPSGLTSHLPGAGLVVQRCAIEQSGWLNKQFLMGRQGKNLTAGEDVEILVRIRRHSYEVWYTPDCVLHHQIPRQRISVDYLARLFYGFGLAAPYLTGMMHPHSYSRFLGLYLLRIGKSMLRTARAWPRDRGAAAITWSYTRGQLTGFRSLVQSMDPGERRLWLGCGTPSHPLPPAAGPPQSIQ